jgi:ribosomal protein S8
MLQQTLAIINAGLKEKKKSIRVPYSNKILKIIKLLYKDGIICNYILYYNYIYIEFSFFEGITVCNGIKLYKRTTSFVYLTNRQLIRLHIKKKNMLLFTVYGINTSVFAVKKKVGGIILGELL